MGLHTYLAGLLGYAFAFPYLLLTYLVWQRPRKGPQLTLYEMYETLSLFDSVRRSLNRVINYGC